MTLALVALLCVVLAAAYSIARSLSSSVTTAGWKTLTSSCIAGIGDDSPATSIAVGGIVGKPFTLRYPGDWQTLFSDQENCTATVGVQPSALLSVNGYGFVGPFSFSPDATYQVNGMTVRQQTLKNVGGGMDAIVSVILEGDHVEGVITLEYKPGLLSDRHYQAVDSAIIGTFEPK